MSNPLISEISRLHRAIHHHDPPTADERERQAAIVMNGAQCVMLELMYQSVHMATLETALFYYWLRLATLNRRLEEALFNTWSSDMGAIMQSVVSELEALAAELKDGGPSDEIRVLGGKIQQLHDLYSELIQQPLPPRTEIERMTDVTNRARGWPDPAGIRLMLG